MRDYARQARVALNIYLARGQQALGFLKKRDFEKFSEMCRLRKAAFHNYRVGESLAAKAGVNIHQEAECLSLWKEIHSLDAALVEAMEHAKEEAGKIVVKLQEAKKRIHKYHSGSKNSRTGFEQAV